MADTEGIEFCLVGRARRIFRPAQRGGSPIHTASFTEDFLDHFSCQTPPVRKDGGTLWRLGRGQRLPRASKTLTRTSPGHKAKGM